MIDDLEMSIQEPKKKRQGRKKEEFNIDIISLSVFFI